MMPWRFQEDDPLACRKANKKAGKCALQPFTFSVPAALGIDSLMHLLAKLLKQRLALQPFLDKAGQHDFRQMGAPRDHQPFHQDANVAVHFRDRTDGDEHVGRVVARVGDRHLQLKLWTPLQAHKHWLIVVIQIRLHEPAVLPVFFVDDQPSINGMSWRCMSSSMTESPTSLNVFISSTSLPLSYPRL
ncbi:hypothetical protein I656_00570 [Geobacillus sp. WSUCF1]|nr:hypothetical protein I656_00570 [Geobacillus sp. WSUCF1]